MRGRCGADDRWRSANWALLGECQRSGRDSRFKIAHGRQALAQSRCTRTEETKNLSGIGNVQLHTIIALVRTERLDWPDTVPPLAYSA